MQRREGAKGFAGAERLNPAKGRTERNGQEK